MTVPATDEHRTGPPTFRTGADMTIDDRMMRIDTLLCILFSGLCSHPLATTLIPPAELEQLRAILPKE